MAYTRNPTWVDGVAGGTRIDAADLNNIENGLVTAANVADTALANAATAQTTANAAAVKANNLSDVASPSTALANLSGVPTSRTITAGTGLSGGGDLTANRTLSVAADAGLPSQTGNSGKFLTTNGTTSSWGTPAGGGGGAWVSPITLAEGAYCSTDHSRSATTTGPAGNVGGNASGYPFALDRDATIDSVSVNNTSAGAASTFSRFMIYSADSSTGKIGSLVWDSGQEAQDVTGVKTFSTSLTLPAGHYWAISVRATGAGAAANYTAYSWGTIPWSSSVADTTNKSFDLGAVSSTSTPPSTWAGSTYTPISRAPIAMWLHVTAVS